MRLSTLSSPSFHRRKPAASTHPRSPITPFACALLLLALGATPSLVAERIQVAYAGSMGVVMDRALGPAFAAAHSVSYEGMGQGAYGLARLIASGQIRPDVFVSITPGPMRVLLDRGLAATAYPIASTQMVIAYNPHGRFAEQLEEAAAGRIPWYEVLSRPGFHFGRTDPAVDPQGQNIIFTMLLAERYYRLPGLAERILGTFENPAQIFSEPSLLSRLEAGQLDAASGYRSAVVSHGLPYITLPDEINLSDARLADSWYRGVSLRLRMPDGKLRELQSQPLVFYAAALANAPNPRLASAFVGYLRSGTGAAILERYGYGGPKGAPLR